MPLAANGERQGPAQQAHLNTCPGPLTSTGHFSIRKPYQFANWHEHKVPGKLYERPGQHYGLYEPRR